MFNYSGATVLLSVSSLLASTLLAASLFAPYARAQQDPVVLDQIKQCAQVAEAAARYACYDRATAAAGMRTDSNAQQGGNTLGTVRQSRIPATIPAPSADPATALSTEPSFQGAPFDPPAVAAGKQAKANGDDNVYHDKITELKEREPGQWLITLASGQQWHQVESKPYRMRAGMDVRIFPGLFNGAWRMSAEGLNGFVQVKRIK
jgi:hypothetical protein